MSRGGHCCDVPGCKRAEPVTIYRGPLSGIVYAVTLRAVIRTGGRLGTTVRPAERHDITAAMLEFITRNPEYVRTVLDNLEPAEAPPAVKPEAAALIALETSAMIAGEAARP